nr:DUF4185 domain-containing protein [Actinomycetes bacterium]
MGAAAYVGRVGGLAVAFGVGSALFAGQGVASAEDSDKSPSSAATSATSDSDTSGDGGSTEKTANAAESDTADDPDDADDADDADIDPDAETEPDDLDLDADDLDDLDRDADDLDPDDLDPDADDRDELDVDADDVDGSDAETDDPADLDGSDAETEPDDPEAVPDPDDLETGTEPKTQDSSTPSNTKTPSETNGTLDAEDDQSTSQLSTAEPSTAEPAASSTDPAVAPQEPKKIAVFANATTLAAASPKVSPTVAALLAPPSTPKPSLLTAVVNVVDSMLEWARQKASVPADGAPHPPFLWALMSFAQRELEYLFASRNTVSAARANAATPTSLTPAVDGPVAAAAAAATAAVTPYSPWPNPQVSESTNFVSWVTGPYVYSDETLVNTVARFQVYGTDVGTMWDNGIADDPATPQNENQVLIAVGDSYGGPNMSGRWIYNTLFRSGDHDLSDGMTIPDGQWFTGNMFGGAPLDAPTRARPIINRPSWLPNSVTLIPTAGVSLPTPETEFGATQYVSFMSVSKWGSAGRWDTNYSAIAYSTDNGENFTIAPQSVRYNSIFSGNRNFQQSAFVKGDDGKVYAYGTPNGRQGAAYLSRVDAEDILDVSKYEYYKKASSGLFPSKAKWVKDSPSSASAIIGKSGG